MTREHIVKVARSWIGVPYRHQGRKRSGVDCIGFIWAVGKDLGIHRDIPTNYPQTPIPDLLKKFVDMYLIPTTRKSVNEMLLGDIVVLRAMVNEPQHFCIVGEYSGEKTMIHSLSRQKRVIEYRWDRFWTPRVVSVHEFPGVDALVQVPA